MDAIEKLQLLVELTDAHCELNHGPNTRNEKFPAVDYITIPLGKDNLVENTLVVPVCIDCFEGLQSEEWTLLYCMRCGESHWVLQELAKLHYTNMHTMNHYHLIGLDGCPHCASAEVCCCKKNRTTSVYFLD
ncbi:MAG TPA: hypothetical protein VI911_06905 [Patescibacteria group bacterium]|nr:hypothetical protein [Patescibacteria group bacterium]